MLILLSVAQQAYGKNIIMVKLCIPLFSALVLFSCQEQQNTEINEDLACQYVTNLQQRYESCKDSVEQFRKKNPSETLRVTNALTTCVPCLYLTKPVFKLANFENETKQIKLAITIFLFRSTVKMDIYLLMFSFYMDFDIFFGNALIYDEESPIKRLNNVDCSDNLKDTVKKQLGLLCDALDKVEFDENINLQINIPKELQPYYQTTVIDKRWVLNYFEQSSGYRKWLENWKPSFDEINRVMPNQKYINYFYECYHSPKIDSNFAIYKFAQLVKESIE